MSWEGMWYQGFHDGREPKPARLCRRVMAEQWQFAIDLAVEFANGTAGYRKSRNSITGEEYWYRPNTGWWMVPGRISQRVRALLAAATQTEIVRGDGRCMQSDVVERLKLWRRNGHWRRIACAIYPRHTPAVTPKKRGRPR
jgi:hypothetical protein